jgi:hypothetical protein
MRVVPVAVSVILIAAGLLPAGPALAQVHKCTDQAGKLMYSDKPCPSTSVKQQVIKVDRVPPAAGLYADDVAAIERDRYGYGTARQSDYRGAVYVRSWSSSSSAAWQRDAEARQRAQDARIRADCRVNRGVDCDSAAEVRRRRELMTEPSPQELAAIHRAAAARRTREQNARGDWR